MNTPDLSTGSIPSFLSFPDLTSLAYCTIECLPFEISYHDDVMVYHFLSYVYTPEVYPTSVRATGLGLCSSIARLGGGTTPYAAKVGLDFVVSAEQNDDALTPVTKWYNLVVLVQTFFCEISDLNVLY